MYPFLILYSVNHTPTVLFPENKTPSPNKRGRWTDSRSGLDSLEKKKEFVIFFGSGSTIQGVDLSQY